MIPVTFYIYFLTMLVVQLNTDCGMLEMLEIYFVTL